MRGCLAWRSGMQARLLSALCGRGSHPTFVSRSNCLEGTDGAMPRTMKLLVVANRAIESEEVRAAIVDRAAAGPVHVTLVAPMSIGAGPPRARRTETAQRLERARRLATAQRLERAVHQLREAGVPVEGVVGG